jgi:hypothetical protein
MAERGGFEFPVFDKSVMGKEIRCKSPDLNNLA